MAVALVCTPGLLAVSVAQVDWEAIGTEGASPPAAAPAPAPAPLPAAPAPRVRAPAATAPARVAPEPPAAARDVTAPPEVAAPKTHVRKPKPEPAVATAKKPPVPNLRPGYVRNAQRERPELAPEFPVEEGLDVAMILRPGPATLPLATPIEPEAQPESQEDVTAPPKQMAAVPFEKPAPIEVAEPEVPASPPQEAASVVIEEAPAPVVIEEAPAPTEEPAQVELTAIEPEVLQPIPIPEAPPAAAPIVTDAIQPEDLEEEVPLVIDAPPPPGEQNSLMIPGQVARQPEAEAPAEEVPAAQEPPVVEETPAEE